MRLYRPMQSRSRQNLSPRGPSLTGKERHPGGAHVSHAAVPATDLCHALALRKAARHLTGLYDRHLAASGVTVTQYAILHRLRQEPRTINALAAALATDRTTMGRNLRPLERDGLIAIQADVQDARRRALSITAEGIACLRRARDGWAAAQAEFEERYGAEPARALRETLAGVVALDLSARS